MRDPDCVLLRLGVTDRVYDVDHVCVCVGVVDAVYDVERDCDADAERLAVGDPLGEPVELRLALGEPELLALEDWEPEDDGERVARLLPVAACEGEGVPELACDGVGAPDAVADPVALAVTAWLADAVAS